MRRYFFILLFFAALVAPFALQWKLGKKVSEQKSDKANTIKIITSHFEGIRREYASAFSEWHLAKYGTPAYIDYRFYGSPDIKKYLKGLKQASIPFDLDLAWGGGDYFFDVDLKGKDIDCLEGFNLDSAILADAFPKTDLNGVALYDQSKPPCWFGTALSSFGILYNKDVLKYLDLPEPKTWRDLANPKYRGWIVMADPTRSASARTVFMIICERAMADAKAEGRSEDDGWAEGMGLVRLIAANCRLFTGSSESMPAMVASGDVAVAMCIDFHGRAQVDAIGDARMAYIEPLGATAINPDPIGLIKGAPNRDLAVHFIEFVLSKQGQVLLNIKPGKSGGPKETALRRLPVMPSAYDRIADFSDQVNPFTESNGFNKSFAREKTFSMLGDFIAYSCIDLLDELRETRIAISKSKNKDALEAKLGKFPLDQKQALDRMKQYKDADKAGDVKLKLRLQREWTNEFRMEYQKLRAEAQQ